MITGSGFTRLSLASQRCGIRFARRPSSSGSPSAQRVVAEDVERPPGQTRAFCPCEQMLPGGVSNMPPNSIIAALLSMELIALPAFADNLDLDACGERSSNAVVVDPGAWLLP